MFREDISKGKLMKEAMKLAKDKGKGRRTKKIDQVLWPLFSVEIVLCELARSQNIFKKLFFIEQINDVL